MVSAQGVALPRAVRALNAAGGGLQRLGLPLLPLRVEALLERAARRAGCDDFGDPAFREPLGVLVDSLEREAALTTLGRITVRSDLLRLLENRLRMVATWKRHPELLAGEVRAPLFVVGLPRTGTSILHELLAQDPANRTPMTWEVMHPWPPPERASFESDARIERVERHYAGIDRLIPGFKRMHPMGARLPQECVALTAHDFASLIFASTHRLPAYSEWLDAADLGFVYASHRRQLQYLQWCCPAERWALKSPGHLWALDALLAAYPDARIVQTHRDPLRVVASLANLVNLLRRLASEEVDPHEIGREWTRRLADGLGRALRVRETLTGADAERCLDVHFEDFMADEIGTVRRVYAHCGWGLSAETERRMRDFLAAHPRGEHGAHRYTLADAGLDPAVERRRYADYVERFGVATGRVD